MGTARTSELSSKPLQKSSGRESPSRVIFNYAYRRIWSGNGLWIFETVLWCLACAYVAFKVFDLTSYQLKSIVETICRFGLPGLTPIIIGIAIYKAMVNIGTGDESLRGVPLTGYQVVGPRFLAIFLTWLQLIAPMLVVFLVLTLYMVKGFSYFPVSPYVIFSFGYFFVEWFVGDSLSHIWHSGPSGNFTPVAILLLQAVGWGLLPISWGLIWATIYQRRGGPFLVVFLLYLLIPALFFSAVHWNIFGFNYEDHTQFWVLVYLNAIGFSLLAILYFFIACWLWDRRSG